MRKLPALLAIGIMVIAIPLQLAIVPAQDAKAVLEIDHFAGDVPNMDITINETLENGSAGVEVPSSGEITKASFSVTSKEHMVEEAFIAKSETDFKEHEIGSINTTVRDDSILLQDGTGELLIAGDEDLNRSTRTDVDVDDGAHLRKYSGTWVQSGFQDGPGYAEVGNEDDWKGYDSGSGLDWSSHQGPLRILPTYTIGSFTNHMSNPTMRGKMGCTIDSDENYMYIYGGTRPFISHDYNNTHKMDLDDFTWSAVCTNCPPGDLYDTAMVEVGEDLLMAGGRDSMGSAVDITWRTDNTDFWYDTNHYMPNGILGHTAVVMPGTNDTLVFGGKRSWNETATNDLLIYNDGWTDLSLQFTNAPPGRLHHTAVWDPDGRRMIVFGGVADVFSMDPQDDVFILDYDNNTWIKPSTSWDQSPAPRFGHGAVWDEDSRAMIVHGGNGQGNILGDIWVYWPTNNSWMQVSDGSSNTGKSHMATVWSESRDRMYSWGGFSNLTGGMDKNTNFILDREYDRTAEMLSSVLGTGVTVQLGDMVVDARKDSDDVINVYVRTGSTMDPDAGDWTQWYGPFTDEIVHLQDHAIPPNDHIQYRVEMSSGEGGPSPELHGLTIEYFYFEKQGNLVTEPRDLGHEASNFTVLETMTETPPGTEIEIEVQSSNDQINWDTVYFEDNSSLYRLDPGRYVRFDITLLSEIPHLSPFLFSLSLGHSHYMTNGSFIMDMGSPKGTVEQILPAWNATLQGTEGTDIEFRVSVDDGASWHELFQEDLWRSPPNEPADPPSPLLLNISFESRGGYTPVLYMFELEIGYMSIPTDLHLDIGGDGPEDWVWPGKHPPGDTVMTNDLSLPLQEVVDDLSKSAGGRMVEVPLSFRSKGPCRFEIAELMVHVEIDNYLPDIISEPPTEAYVGYTYEYTIVAKDEDGDHLEYGLEFAPVGMYILEAMERGDPVLYWVPTEDDLGQHDIILTVSDGTDEARQYFTLNVTRDKFNHPPYFVSLPPELDPLKNVVEVTVGQEYVYQVSVMDQDLEDMTSLRVSLEIGLPSMEFDGLSNTFSWTPSEKAIGNYKVVLRVSDGKGYEKQEFMIEVIPDTNRAPILDEELPGTLETRVGEDFSYRVRASDPEGGGLTYSLEGAPSWLSIDDRGVLTGKAGEDDVGRDPFNVIISDGQKELVVPANVTVEEADDPLVPGMGTDALMMFLLLAVIAAVVVATVGYGVHRRRKARRTGEELMAGTGTGTGGTVGEAGGTDAGPGDGTDHPGPPSGPDEGPSPTGAGAAEDAGAGAAGAAGAAAGTAGPATGAGAGKAEEKPIIEDVYLIYNDGRLIAHEARRLRPDMDDTILSGMLKAIQDFVKDSFQKEGSLGGLDYGDSRIMLETGRHATLALVISGRETAALREEMRRTLEKIEGLYAGVIEDWDGDTKHFKDIGKYLMPLILMGRTLDEDAEMGEVRLMSALEFYQGYVRLKVAVKNKYPYMIHDVDLKVIYDKKALQLSHIEPEYEMEGPEVVIGNVAPKEKKTVAFYLDPLICMESNIDASAMYKNYKGEIETAMMKRRPVDIVCPIFYTEQNVNVAMLKRLINELKYSDSKIFTIPKSLTPEQSFALSKETVQAHDVRFVREFTEEDPFIGEAWYYGKTKQSLEDLVIRVTVREETRTLEIFVASSNLATLPGLLTELAHGLKRNYTTSRKTKEDLTQVTDEEVKGSLEKSKLLLEKYASKEIEAESEEIDI